MEISLSQTEQRDFRKRLAVNSLSTSGYYYGVLDLVQFQALDLVHGMCHRRPWNGNVLDLVQGIKVDLVHRIVYYG